MRALCATMFLAFLSITPLGCGSEGDEEPPTCSEWVQALYAVENCAMYDISVSPPAALSQNEVTIWCREVVGVVNTNCTECEDEMNAWLACVPDECTWNESMQIYLANDCNDEYDRLLACCP